MNVLIVNASPRRKGVISTLLGEVEATIGDSNHVEVVRVPDLDMTPCIGCLKCRPDRTCVLPRDGAHALADSIRWADLVVFGSPVYWGNMPGALKVFFDRNVTLFEYCEATSIRYIPHPQLKGKRAVLFVSGGTPFPFNLLPSQSRGTVRAFKTILKAGGVKIDSVVCIPDSYDFDRKRERYERRVRRITQTLTA